MQFISAYTFIDVLVVFLLGFLFCFYCVSKVVTA